MGDATLNGVPFRCDPDSVSWDFKPKVISHKTVGGKVVQVYGVELGPLVVAGAFGRGGWEEQQTFLARMKELGDNQMDSYPSPPPQPYRFFWPQKKWDMLVWLKGYSDGSHTSVTLTNEEINPKWVLTFHIVEDNSGLKKVAADAYIERLSAGLGWEQTTFNGPMTASDAKNIWMQVGATNVRDFTNIAFGRGTQTPTGNQDAEGGAPAANASGPIQDYAKTQAAGRGWTGEDWDALYDIVQRESSWNPAADNPTSTAFGLFQFLDSTWAGTGISRTPDPYKQIDAGLKYIASRYGTPSAALAFHIKNGYY